MKFILYVYICVVFVKACKQHKTCGACIKDAGACVWCERENMQTFNEPRCISENSLPQNWCAGNIINPGSSINISGHRDYNSSSENIVQIKPQNIKMKLRPGQTINFYFNYSAAEHYPVDLYFLYHASMNEKLWKNMVNLTEEVYQFLHSMTKNTSIGFGTFIDKNKAPFMAINNSTLAYSFKHRYTLSSEYAGFIKATDGVNIKSSKHNDNPEGGFDALAQVLACDEVGWRKVSRKIVVFATDTSYHAAGDGSQAGIINPYDGKCYIENGSYTKELEMDYPSIPIINKLASDREVTIIYVISRVKSSYENLEKVINGARVIYPEASYGHEASVASELTNTYENIVREIKLKVNTRPAAFANKVKLFFSPECDKMCEVKQNQELKITGNITVSEYFEADNIKVDIGIQGIKEKLTLDIELIRDCDCKTGNNGLCMNKGTQRCGICECYPDRIGEFCECSSKNSTSQDKGTCVAPNTTLECSGRGTCACGNCICGERYTERYCECDKESCPRDKNGVVCGHGNCIACTGECVCEPGWSKASQSICDCDDSTDSCRTGPYMCFNYGQCKCNECKCPATICKWDARSTQDQLCRPVPCPDCHTRQCQLLEPYALASSIRDMPCKARVNITSVKRLGNETTWKRCADVRADVGCYTEFAYKYDDEKYGIHLIVQSEYDCAESNYIYGGACLGTLILIGIVTLAAWKLLSVYRDRKEYRRFLKQYREGLETSHPVVNYLYDSPTRTTNNPNYRKQSLW